MRHDHLCELKDTESHVYIGAGCGCAKRALDADPLPPELVPIYPTPQDPPCPALLTSTTWIAKTLSSSHSAETWADVQADMLQVTP
jgi:hypothetical protein